MVNRDGRGRGTSEPEKNLRKAQERLKEAEQKAANCKRWQPELQQAIIEYSGQARVLAGALETDLKHAIHILDQKLEALERYLAVAAPEALVLDPLSSTTPESVASAAPEDASAARMAPEGSVATAAEAAPDKAPEEEEPKERTTP